MIDGELAGELSGAMVPTLSSGEQIVAELARLDPEPHRLLDDLDTFAFFAEKAASLARDLRAQLR